MAGCAAPVGSSRGGSKWQRLKTSGRPSDRRPQRLLRRRSKSDRGGPERYEKVLKVLQWSPPGAAGGKSRASDHQPSTTGSIIDDPAIAKIGRRGRSKRSDAG